MGRPASNFVDHTGTRFGKLIAVRYAPRKAKSGQIFSYWIVRCDCGREKSIFTSSLVQGLTTSCGCLRKERIGQSKRFIAGTKYNFLTLVRFHEMRPRKSGSTTSIWICKCDCGVEKAMIAVNIRNGNTQSCGCKKGQLISKSQKLPGYAALFNIAYNAHVHAAKKRNLITFLSREEYFSIIKKPCSYCGKVSKRKDRSSGEMVEANSADRINNEPYYSIENTVPACFDCQWMKGDRSKVDFLSHLEDILRFQNKSTKPQQEESVASAHPSG